MDAVEVNSILAEIQLPFGLLTRYNDVTRSIQVGMHRQCAYGGGEETGWSGKYYVSSHAIPDEIVKMVLGASLAYMEHEVREGFLFQGDRLFGPHIAVGALQSVARMTTYREKQ